MAEGNVQHIKDLTALIEIFMSIADHRILIVGIFDGSYDWSFEFHFDSVDVINLNTLIIGNQIE